MGLTPALVVRRRPTIRLVLLLAVLTSALPAAASPARPGVRRSFRQTPAAYALRFQTPVAPGVDLDGFTSATGPGAANSDVLTVDLTHPGIRTGVLSNRVTDVAPVAGWANRFGAVAAINGDYYDIGASQAPQGPVVRDGVLRKGTRAGQSMTGLGTDGELRTSTEYLDGTVTWGSGATHAIDVYNSDLFPGVMPPTGLAVLDGAWGGSALTFFRPPKKVSVVTVGANHKVLATSNKVSGHTVPPHGFLLIGTGNFAGIGTLRKGTVVRTTLASHTDAGFPFVWGLGAGLQLMRNGSVIHNFIDDSDSHDARTALGWSNGGRTMIVVTVERGGGSGGEGVNEIADEMAAAGASDAVLLDGGGSTTLVARPQGAAGPSQIGAAADGYQRSVPVGVGVFVPRGSGLVYGFAPTLDAGSVFPGLHRQLGYRAWDEWYGAAAFDPGTAALVSDNPGLLRFDGSGRVLALRPGRGHLVATAPTSAPGSPGTVTASAYLQVLQPLSTLQAPAAVRIVPGQGQSIALSGADSLGETAPVLATDVSASYDHSLLAVGPAPDGSLRITARPVPEGPVTPVTLTVAGVTTTIVVHLGYATVPLLAPTAPGALRVVGGGVRVVPLGPGLVGLKISPTKAAATAVAPRAAPVPAGSVFLAVTVIGDGGRHTITLITVDAGGHQHRSLLGTVTGRRPVRLQSAAPAGGGFVAVAIGSAGGRKPGYVVLTQVAARL